MNINPQSSDTSEIKINKIKNRILQISPIVSLGLDRECSKNDFTREDNSLIDYGCLGKLWRVSQKKTDEVYGIKVMQKEKIMKSGQSLIDSINSVIKLMYTVRHQSVVMLLNNFEDEENLYLIFQDVKLDQGNLSNQLIKITEENKLLSIMKQVIFVIIYLHSKETPIINRQIKPENILLDEKLEIAKLTDYAWSDLINLNKNSSNEINVNSYTAPEIITKSEITTKIDVWNLGVLFYEILTGVKAFKGKNNDELKDKILNCKIQWSGVKFPSEMSKNLVKSMLKIKPEERPSLNDILNNILFQSPLISIPSLLNKKIDDEEFIINKKITYKKSSLKSNDIVNEKIKQENEQLKVDIEKLKKEITNLENENLSLKEKLEKYTKENFEINIINTDPVEKYNLNSEENNLNPSEIYDKLSDLEERSQELLEYRSKIRLLEYESELLKIDFEEIKQKNEEYETEIKNLSNLLEEERNDKNLKIENLSSKIEMLENSIFNYNSNSKNTETNLEDLYKNLLTIVTNLLKEFKEVVLRLQNKSIETNENLSKSLRDLLNEKEDNIKELIYKTKESLENELRTKSFQNFTNSSTQGKFEKIDWMQKQINELMPYKLKSLNMKETIEKYEEKNKLLSEKIKLMEIEINTLNSIVAIKEDTLYNLRQYVTNIEDKLSDTKDFIMRRCPEKVEEFFQIYY